MIVSDMIHTFPKEEIFVYGDIEQLHDLLIIKNVEAWRALPEKMRKHLMCTTEWQYYFDERMILPNLIINDLEIRWNGAEWVVMAFHSE
jgi:hypothetical protein